MSDIKAGDLVVIVHQCCDWCSELGEVGVVDSTYLAWAMCDGCRLNIGVVPVAKFVGHPGSTPLSWLKKIPPLSDLEEAQSTKKEPEAMPIEVGVE